MPKNYPKAQRKKTRAKKTQPKPVSITTRKSYWITLTLAIALFASVVGYLVNMPLNNIVMMLATVLSLIGFAVYIRFTPSTAVPGRRATFIFVGASIIGFQHLGCNCTFIERNSASSTSCKHFLCHNKPNYLLDFRRIYR
jgi:uncharacterized membrane protein